MIPNLGPQCKDVRRDFVKLTNADGLVGVQASVGCGWHCISLSSSNNLPCFKWQMLSYYFVIVNNSLWVCSTVTLVKILLE